MCNIDINNINSVQDMTQFLKQNQDETYREFTSKLIPNINKETIIGVRTPIVRNLAKALKGTDVSREYLSNPKHEYLEENHLHSFLIETISDFDTALKLTKDFLPYIDNWATCDTIRPKVFRKDLDTLFEHIKIWLESNHTYTVRYAIGLLNSFYLDDEFKEEQFKLVSSIKSDEYYINMMIAWYFSTALCKQFDSAVLILQEQRLSKWTHNKTIQKARESLRIDKDTKNFLRTLKIK